MIRNAFRNLCMQEVSEGKVVQGNITFPIHLANLSLSFNSMELNDFRNYSCKLY